MSRYSFDQRDGGCLSIGWDPPLNTFFLQIDADREEPTILEGSSYGQHLEPERLVRYARRRSGEVPSDLAVLLRADQAAEPAWAPIEERIAGGELKVKVKLVGSDEAEPVELSPEAGLRWYREEAERVGADSDNGPQAARDADPAGWAASEEERPGPAASPGFLRDALGVFRSLWERLNGPAAPPPARIDLDVPFASKDEAKRLGARWDAEARTWYIDDRYELDLFARWIPSSPEYERTYLDVPFGDKDRVRLLGARWDVARRRWYVPSGVEVAPFAPWSEQARPSLVNTYHERSSEQARYYLVCGYGGFRAGSYLDDLEEAKELASAALADDGEVELRDNRTQKVWRGVEILKL
ncbi:DUF5710 domain-containing protein [Sphingomonas lenta]|nr:DUF5710 domain-containing protein [Sphingomonas lenta]